MDIFDQRLQERMAKEAPLAARMRPRTLDEFIGQEQIVGPGRLLRRAIQADQLSSLIFFGPPGTGKTTLAAVIANTTRSHFVTLNAVLAGVRDIRRVTAEAQERRKLHNRRTILFVDEVHRWNKAQQDALLPWVENGTVILIGATTENPYFSVNRPLVSRSRVFQLKSLGEGELRKIAERTLADPDRGYGRLPVTIHPDALDHLVNVANGDARALLNALELAVETTPPDTTGQIVVDMTVAEESIQRRAVLYDKEGDYHFDTISAFIKSLRGSDPDAAMYWLAKMVYAGEDPRFIFRRMLIFAGEDVGLADPQAICIVNACAEAFDRVGLPEGRFHLAEAALYLATAPKSNSVFAFFDALNTVEQEREGEVPTHLKDASRDKEGFGHGRGYLYPHAFRDHWVAQQYLPDSLQGQFFYRPGKLGYEAGIGVEVQRRREARLAAVVESDLGAPLELLTVSPTDRAAERWLQRTVSQAGDRLGHVRDRVLDATRIQRHHVVLDLRAGSGLLIWEVLRRAPEGGAWALVHTTQETDTLRELASHLPELNRPIVIEGDLADLPHLLAQHEPELRFDAIVGHNALLDHREKAAAFQTLAALLKSGGRLSLAETIPRHAPRLYRLADLSSLGAELVGRVEAAEEAIYEDPDDARVNWDMDDLRTLAEAAGFAEVQVVAEEQTYDVQSTPALLTRWFGISQEAAARPTYGQRLRRFLDDAEVAQVQALFERELRDRTISWTTHSAHLTATRGGA